MSLPSAGDVTGLLEEVSLGNRDAADRLLVTLYAELRKLARAQMARERPGQTLQPTALVHEAYLRLVRIQNPVWECRGHFFVAAAEAMRRILVERARHRRRIRHGGQFRRTDLNEMLAGSDVSPEEFLDLDEALSKLESLDRAMASVVKLRYFSGLTISETATVLNLSESTVNRHWLAAKTWLHRELSEKPAGTRM